MKRGTQCPAGDKWICGKELAGIEMGDVLLFSENRGLIGTRNPIVCIILELRISNNSAPPCLEQIYYSRLCLMGKN